jgi:hypothetical protein
VAPTSGEASMTVKTYAGSDWWHEPGEAEKKFL